MGGGGGFRILRVLGLRVSSVSALVLLGFWMSLSTSTNPMPLASGLFLSSSGALKCLPVVLFHHDDGNGGNHNSNGRNNQMYTGKCRPPQSERTKKEP